ncbi:hypothetical protein D3C76_749090 [compost metagenome]
MYTVEATQEIGRHFFQSHAGQHQFPDMAHVHFGWQRRQLADPPATEVHSHRPLMAGLTNLDLPLQAPGPTQLFGKMMLLVAQCAVRSGGAPSVEGTIELRVVAFMFDQVVEGRARLLQQTLEEAIDLRFAEPRVQDTDTVTQGPGRILPARHPTAKRVPYAAVGHANAWIEPRCFIAPAEEIEQALALRRQAGGQLVAQLPSCIVLGQAQAGALGWAEQRQQCIEDAGRLRDIDVEFQPLRVIQAEAAFPIDQHGARSGRALRVQLRQQPAAFCPFAQLQVEPLGPFGQVSQQREYQFSCSVAVDALQVQPLEGAIGPCQLQQRTCLRGQRQGNALLQPGEVPFSRVQVAQCLLGIGVRQIGEIPLEQCHHLVIRKHGRGQMLKQLTAPLALVFEQRNADLGIAQALQARLFLAPVEDIVIREHLR